jgi:hypothetical protein
VVKQEKEQGTLVFVYDGFMLPENMKALVPDAEFLDLATIPHKRLFFTGSKYNQAVASVLDFPGKFLEGAVYVMSDKGLRTFTGRMGSFYLPKTTTYKTGESVYPCTYFVHRDGLVTKGLPTKMHFAPIVNAYQTYDLEWECLEDAIDFCCK